MIRIMATLRREFVLGIEIMDGVTFWEKYWRAITLGLRAAQIDFLFWGGKEQTALLQ